MGAGVVILDLCVTGFATWTGAGMLGIPSSTPVLLLVLWACWQAIRLTTTTTTSP